MSLCLMKFSLLIAPTVCKEYNSLICCMYVDLRCAAFCGVSSIPWGGSPVGLGESGVERDLSAVEDLHFLP